jgi:hypothetical protein
MTPKSGKVNSGGQPQNPVLLSASSRADTPLQRRGPLAQLVEHLTLNQGVTGSIPVRPTNISPVVTIQ